MSSKDLVEFDRAWIDSYIRTTVRPPFWSTGTCPMLDMAGSRYDWGRICSPGWGLAGYILDESIEVGHKVAGQGILIGLDIVLTSARVLQGREVSNLTFIAPAALGGVGRRAKVVASSKPRSGVTYSDPLDLNILVAQESSDIAMLRLERAAAGTVEPSWVPMGLAPRTQVVDYYRNHPDERCPTGGDCRYSFADAVLYGHYPSHGLVTELLTPVKWVSVSSNGSVLVAFNDHHAGDTAAGVEGVSYSPAMDRGAPVVTVGASNKPEIVGVVSGYMDLAGESTASGVYYRITRCDRWSGWVADTLRSWYPGVTPPGPGAPPPQDLRPPTTRWHGQRLRKGSLVAAGITTAVVAGVGLYAVR